MTEKSLSKSTLSMYLRSKCDRQLYLSLFRNNPETLRQAGLPLPLKSRPGVQIITQSGRDFETQQFDELQRAIPGHVVCNPKFAEIALEQALSESNQRLPFFIFQPSFKPEQFREVALQNLGLSAPEIDVVPRLSALRPDILFVFRPDGLNFEILPNGRRLALREGDSRLGISVIDLKNVTEANASYSAEVCLYAHFLSNWLAQDNTGLKDKYYVSDKIYLWKHVEMPNFSRVLSLREGSNAQNRIDALLEDLSDGLVEFVIFMPSVAKFFKEDIPRVVNLGDSSGWGTIPYHVNERCGACDWLGIKSWLSPTDEAVFSANTANYCFPSAENTDHLSMLPGISRGASVILTKGGHPNLANLVDIDRSAAVLTRHSILKRDRSQIGRRAKAIHANETSLDEDVKIAGLAGSSNLNVEFDIVVNFDSGTGLLTGIAVRGIMFPPFQQTFTTSDGTAVRFHRFPEEAFVVERNVNISEWAALKGFIKQLSKWALFAQQTFTDNRWGTCKAQICFWESRQYEELCNCFGRHLHLIMDLPERDAKALAWIFPSEELMERDEQITPGIVFVSDIIQSVTRLPIRFVHTLLGVAEVYHHNTMSPRKIDPYYREPLGNAIPRERIYEIWKSTTGTVQMYGQTEPLSKAVQKYGEILKANAWALASITARLRVDFARRLSGNPPAINLSLPLGATGVAHDSKLWIRWDEVESSTAETERKNELIARTDTLESSYKAIIFTTLLQKLGGFRYKFAVSDESTEAKIDEGNAYLVLGFQNIPGFALLTAAKLGVAESPPDVDASVLRIPLHKVVRVNLESFDRVNREATIVLNSSYSRYDGLFNLLMTKGYIPIEDQAIYLTEGLPYNDSKTTEEILKEVGNPPSAAPSPQSLKAMGLAPKRITPGTSPETAISSILWRAKDIAKEVVRTADQVSVLAAYAYGKDNSLDSSQQLAIMACLRYKLAIIWGPPGTGKTKTLSAFLRSICFEAQTGSQTRKILVTGPNYRAVDELAERLLHNLNCSPECKADIFWVYSKSRVPKPVSEFESNIRAFATQMDSSDGGAKLMKDSLADGNTTTIIATTAHNVRSLSKFLFGYGSSAIQELFDLVVIDESSQVPVTLAIKALSSLKVGGQVIIAGDHLQMPPISSLDAPLNAEYMVGSIQTYLRERFSVPVQPLLVNYRSTKDLVDFAKTLGYPQDLQAHTPGLRLGLIDDLSTVINSIPSKLPVSDSYQIMLDPAKKVLALIHDDIVSSQANQLEAEIVAALAFALKNAMCRNLYPHHGRQPDQPYSNEDFFRFGLGVVTPHKAQKSLVIRELTKLFPMVDPKMLIECVDTVERFQGGERHTIIVSYGVGDVDIIQGEELFLMQMERTNVAVSRAKAKCIVVMPKALAYHLPSDPKATRTAKAVKTYVEEFCSNRAQIEISFGGEVRKGEVRWH